MPDDRIQIRHNQLFTQLEKQSLDALVLNPGPSLWYLTGLELHLSERPAVVIFRPGGVPVVVLPELEVGKARALPFDVRVFTYDENPSTWRRAFEAAAYEADLDYRRVGVEPTRLRVLELRLLEEVAPRAAYINGSAAVDALRAIKDPAEIESARKAVQIAERALEQALDVVRLGMTEQEFERELTLQLLRCGSAPELPFSPIVAFGENAANPHAAASDRELRSGDLILVDWGASANGYFSDLTRVFCHGETDARLREIGAIVRDANEAAREAARPGVTASEVDRAARSVIEAAGYGEQFTHRTGHGLGLDVHEEPYIRNGNDRELSVGMLFTIEPGIYLPQIGGIRIEDDVVITKSGSESLTTIERDLVNLAERSDKSMERLT